MIIGEYMIKYIGYLLLLLLMLGCSNKELILFSKAECKQSLSDNQKIKKEAASSKTTLITNPIKISKVKSPKFDNIKFDYKIVPHDRVAVHVYKHPELSSTTDRGLLVNAKGNIRLPLVKTISIVGLTQTQAHKKIEDAFKRYIKFPDISFEVLNKRAYVIGEVNSPGEIELLNEKLTLLQILSKAGDLKDSADKTKIMILRNRGERVESEIVNLIDINSLKTASLMIKPNDIVYVLPNEMRLFNTKVSEISPIFGLISSILSPFITLKILSN